MSSLLTQVAADLAGIYAADEFATAATYTSVSGDSSSINAIISYGSGSELPGADDLGVTAEMQVQTADVPEMEQGDTITVGSTVWEVLHAIKSSDGLEWICQTSKQ